MSSNRESYKFAKSLLSRFPRFYSYISKIYLKRREKQIKKDLMRISKNNKPIIVGPWLSEVGFEVLYWIPFLRWLIEKHQIDKKRIYVVSRGGARIWYEGITEKYIDLFELFSIEKFKIENEKRVAKTHLQKQMNITNFDEEILKKVKKKCNFSQYQLLHPSYMYTLFQTYWSQNSSIKIIEKYTYYTLYKKIVRENFLKNLPDKFIAVKFYFNDSFPKINKNIKFIYHLINLLSQKNHIILLNTGLNIDDHDELSIKSTKKIINFENKINPNINLEIQTKIISQATAFFGTYGGF